MALSELDVNQEQAENMTVITLREKLRANREVHRMAKSILQDSFDQLPQRLEKMKLEELKDECARRSLPLTAKATRPQLIVMIRDDVESRIQHAQTIKEKEEEDWLMADQSSQNPIHRSNLLMANASCSGHISAPNPTSHHRAKK